MTDHFAALARFHGDKSPIIDPVNGAWSVAQAEFYRATNGAAAYQISGSQRGIDASAARLQAQGEAYQAGIDMAAAVSAARLQAQGEAYLAVMERAGADVAEECAILSEALAKFHESKPIVDPANGAWSAAQAEFYVAQFGGADALVVSAENGALASLCSF
jgi:hypothetical protein